MATLHTGGLSFISKFGGGYVLGVEDVKGH